MPGVVVTTAVRSGPTGVGAVESSQMFIAGEFQRGPTDEAKLVRSFSEFKTYYGEYTTSTTAWVPVKTFFENGGSRAYVGRVVNGGAVAEGTLNDGSLDTIDFDAADVGTWGNDLVIAVIGANSLAGGFRITVTLDGDLLLTTPDLADVAAAVSYINTSSVSHLVVAENNTDSTSNPAEGSVTLSGGTDGSATTDTEYNTALGLFTYDLGAGVVCMPGQTSTTAYANLESHATANHRIAFCALAAGTDVDVAKTNAAAAGTAAGDEARRMAFFYPHIKVEDPADAGLTVTISPETFAAAARSKAINEAGSPHRAGAGLISAASSYVKGIEDGYAVDKAAGDLLDEARVNAIRSIGGSIRVYGARSLSTDEANWRFITFQDMVNHIAVEAEERLEDFVFSTIDSRGGLFGQIRGSMIAMLDPHRISGGLYEAFDAGGERVDPGYSVVVNDDNNPASQLANGQVKVDVGIRVSSVGDKINVTITKSNLTASVV
jgi:hypothetical protein